MIDDNDIRNTIKRIGKIKPNTNPHWQKFTPEPQTPQPPTPQPIHKTITPHGLVRITGANDPTKISIVEWNNVIDHIEALETRINKLEQK